MELFPLFGGGINYGIKASLSVGNRMKVTAI